MAQSLSRALHALMKDRGLAQKRPDHEERTKFRATVYCHDSQRKVFVPLARSSDNPQLQRPGRSEYPDNEGFIAKAWATPWSRRQDLPADDDAWVESVVSQDRMSIEVASNLTMRSRSLIGVRISGLHGLEAGPDRTGIIIAESLNPRGLKLSEFQSAATASKRLPAISTLCTIAQSKMVETRG